MEYMLTMIIALPKMAKRLGRNDIYDRFIRQSANWKNLWRSDYGGTECVDLSCRVLPKDNGWTVCLGNPKVFHPLIKYTPVIRVTPWHIPWWSTFFTP